RPAGAAPPPSHGRPRARWRSSAARGAGSARRPAGSTPAPRPRADAPRLRPARARSLPVEPRRPAMEARDVRAMLAPMRRLVRAFAVFLISGVAVPIGVAVTVLASFLFLPLPATLPEAKAGVEARITHVYLADGTTEIAIFREFET